MQTKARRGRRRHAADLPEELTRRLALPVPRYTSYPTAPQMNEEFGAEEWRACLDDAATRTDEALGLYVHLPFCERICPFCGCASICTPKDEPIVDYLGVLHTEVDLAARALSPRRALSNLHWGGGTPNLLTEEQMRELVRAIEAAFEPTEDAERSIELDPVLCTPDQLALLRELGFNRVSFGIQDLDPTVQRAIDRIQPIEHVTELVSSARALGFSSVNLDLIYGLPHQTEASFDRTLQRIIRMRPDRLAIFGFAYVPDLRRNQRVIEEEALPSPELRLELLLIARTSLVRAGYIPIGIDHYARPNDSLARASLRGTLHRDFQGYTDRGASELVGVGITSISDVAGCYAQNEKKLNPYYETVKEGHLPVRRGRARTADDELRGHVIRDILCRFGVDLDEVAEAHGVDRDAAFGPELADLPELATLGLLRADGPRLELTPRGRLFARNVAAVFDRYLRARRTTPSGEKKGPRHAAAI